MSGSAQKPGSLSDYPLGRHDIPKELLIAPGLYGREDEIAALETALERVRQGATEMVLISGTAGVGKTALVGEIHKSVAQKNGFLISGTISLQRTNTGAAGTHPRDTGRRQIRN